MSLPQFHVAVIGGGITGACVASTLLKRGSNNSNNIVVDVLDQGRRGAGGRCSQRLGGASKNVDMIWDHGCQFFRADTPQFQHIVGQWLEEDICRVWTGHFCGTGSFFGFPHQPPFYVGNGGMKTIVEHLLTGARLYQGTRVSQVTRGDNNKWQLVGTSGDAAFHDTPEQTARRVKECVIGNPIGYDAVILTDVSSSFGGWHRASAGIPQSFAKQVVQQAGSRTPLFAAMIALDGTIANLDAISFDDHVIWFAAKTSSKPGFDKTVSGDCWTLISTPEYAMHKIEETPMQDPTTGEFIPQSREYLAMVPGTELEESFRRILESGALGDLGKLPATTFLSAQRWGSAMPSKKDAGTKTGRCLSGVWYDTPMDTAPTQKVGDGLNFVADDDRKLYQAGDMVSYYSPGFEGAALSGFDVAEHVARVLESNPKSSKSGKSA